MIGRSRLRWVAGPVATLLLIAAAAQVLWNNFERSKEASQSVEHTYRVLISCERFLSTIREAESAVRAYIITRDRRYLEPYDADLNMQARILADLERLMRDNPQQQTGLKKIRELTAQRLAVMADALRLVNEANFDIRARSPRDGRGARIMSELTSQLVGFEEEEHRLLAEHTNAAGAAVSRTRFMLIFTSSLLALVLLFAGAWVERDIRHRDLAYDALQRQADLINFSHDAIVTLDPDRLITGWNAGAVEIYGWSQSEALGRPAHEILPTQGNAVAAQIEEALSRTGRWDGELTQTGKSGQTCVVESRYVQVRNRAGAPVGVLNISRDETQRRQAEELQKQLAEQRRLALDAGQLGSWDYRVEADQVVWDERCKEIMGLPGLGPANFEQVLKLVHPEERDTMREAGLRAMSGAGDGRFSQEMRILLRDGSVRWLATYGRVYFSENGGRRPVRVIGVNSDITRRKKVEESLRESEERLRVALAESDGERRRLSALLETMPAGILLTDRSDTVMEVNAEALQIWRAESLHGLLERGRKFQGWRADSGDTLRAEDWPRARALRGETVRGEVIDIERFDGTPGTVFNSASAISDARGEIQGAVSVMVDITERRQIELALRRSEESLRQTHNELERLLEQKNILFKEVQHRVKNNLQVISSLLWLEAQRYSDREFHEALHESCDRVRSMALMHEKFYHLDDLARIEFGEYVEELARYFFGSYMQDPSAIGFSSNVDVRLSMDEAIPCGLILQELLSNSVKHAFPQGAGSIRIDFHFVDGTFELKYRDSGLGLPKAVDLNNPATLGLQLVSDLARQLRGTIRYDYAEGALFTLTFS